VYLYRGRSHCLVAVIEHKRDKKVLNYISLAKVYETPATYLIFPDELFAKK
jgi:hypothetical protein